MADKKIRGIVVEIGGDTTGLQKSLGDVNKDLKSTNDQLRDVNKLLKLDPKNTELLAQKQKLLADAAKQSGEKLKTLHEAEKKLKDSGVDENSAQFMALRREIVSTESDEKKYTKQLAETEKETGKVVDINKALEATVKGIGVALAAAGTAALAAGAAIGKAMTKASTEAAAFADDLLTQSEVTGVSTEKLQEYAYAAEIIDVSVETLTGSMRKNIASMTQAAKGTGDAANAYATLGVAVTDETGALLDSEAVYWQTINALSAIEDETQRDSLAMQIFGKSSQELNPLINTSAEELAALGQKAHDVGYVMDGETLDAFGAFDDELQYLKKGTQAAKNALGKVLLPSLTSLAGTGVDALGQITTALAGANGDFSGVGAAISAVIPQIINAIMAQVPMLLQMVASILISLTQAIVDSLPVLVPAIVELVQLLCEYLLQPDVIVPILQAVIDIAVAVALALVNAAPILIEQIPVILKAIGKGLWDAMPALLSTVGDILKSIGQMIWKAQLDSWGYMLDGAKAAWEGIKTVFSKVGTFFKDVFAKAWEGVKNVFSKGGEVFQSIKDTIGEVFKKVVNKVIGGINTVVSAPFSAIKKGLDKLRDVTILGSQPFSFLPDIKVPEIPMLARGGVLSSGSAIVGEAGAEMLTMSNGRAIVQPLSPAAKATAGASQSAQQPLAVTIRFNGDLAELARVLHPALEYEGNRLGTVLVN